MVGIARGVPSRLVAAKHGSTGEQIVDGLAASGNRIQVFRHEHGGLRGEMDGGRAKQGCHHLKGPPFCQAPILWLCGESRVA